MNVVKQIQRLNQQELDNNVPYEASWHQEYADTAYIYIGGLPYGLTEGDILIIFSQYGVPVHVKLMRDRETGESKGFAFLKYEDVRSAVLAVDNLNGAKVLDRVLRVDHTRYDPNKNKDDGREDVSRLWDEAIAKDMLENDFATEEEIEKDRLIEQEEPEADEFADPMKHFNRKK